MAKLIKIAGAKQVPPGQAAAFTVEGQRIALFHAVNDLSCLRVFMHHHVYGVWDFMSLLNYLQHVIAPATWPWQPSASVLQAIEASVSPRH